jgi:hypothetical protein
LNGPNVTFKGATGMVEVNFGDEIILRFPHEVGNFLSQVGDF